MIAHFVGGPQHGRDMEVRDDSSHLFFAVHEPEENFFTFHAPDVPVPTRTEVYTFLRRVGPYSVYVFEGADDLT